MKTKRSLPWRGAAVCALAAFAFTLAAADDGGEPAPRPTDSQADVLERRVIPFTDPDMDWDQQRARLNMYGERLESLASRLRLGLPEWDVLAEENPELAQTLRGVEAFARPAIATMIQLLEHETRIVPIEGVPVDRLANALGGMRQHFTGGDDDLGIVVLSGPHGALTEMEALIKEISQTVAEREAAEPEVVNYGGFDPYGGGGFDPFAPLPYAPPWRSLSGGSEPPSENIELVAHLIHAARGAGDDGAMPEKLAEIVGELRAVFPYGHYIHVDSFIVRCRAGQGFEMAGTLPGLSSEDGEEALRYTFQVDQANISRGVGPPALDPIRFAPVNPRPEGFRRLSEEAGREAQPIWGDIGVDAGDLQAWEEEAWEGVRAAEDALQELVEQGANSEELEELEEIRARVRERATEAAQRSVEAMERSREAAQRSVEAVERSREAVQRSLEATERSREQTLTPLAQSFPQIRITAEVGAAVIRIDGLRFEAGGAQGSGGSIQTAVDITDGQSAVIGKASVGAGGDGAMFLIITARVAD